MGTHLQLLLEQRVVAVVRAPRLDEPERLAEALVSGGIGSIEFTFTTPGVEEAIARSTLAGFTVGAGTVLDLSSAHAALDAGASFIVTPCLVPGVVDLATARNVPVIMGALTPTEVWAAHTAGASAVKIFPASSVGPRHFSNLLGPFPHLKLVASGGIDEESASDYLRAGAVAVAAGSSVVSDRDITARDWRGIEESAKRFVGAIALGA